MSVIIDYTVTRILYVIVLVRIINHVLLIVVFVVIESVRYMNQLLHVLEIVRLHLIVVIGYVKGQRRMIIVLQIV